MSKLVKLTDGLNEKKENRQRVGEIEYGGNSRNDCNSVFKVVPGTDETGTAGYAGKYK